MFQWKLRVFGSMSFNGYKDDVLKSGFQKYVRRCNFDKGFIRGIKQKKKYPRVF
jgi:hypothetical protein